jgi:hypothetical protein
LQLISIYYYRWKDTTRPFLCSSKRTTSLFSFLNFHGSNALSSKNGNPNRTVVPVQQYRSFER